jgi:uncharacterized protein YmfQ (DUF2313 family)
MADKNWDRHLRRSGGDYAQAFLSLLPQGQAWPKEPGSTLTLTCEGLAEYWGFVDGRAADLLERESDPRKTTELLTDWERAWGLPDPCFPEVEGMEPRRRMLVLVMTMLGAQSREWFTWVANWLGFDITIREWAPFMVGISQVGDTRDAAGVYRWEIGPPEMRFYWQVHVSTAALIWFRAASGVAGYDPHLRIITPPDLQCLLNRWKPAHTQIVFSYSNLRPDDPMAGTP